MREEGKGERVRKERTGLYESGVMNNNEEFDPGSERTLAVRIKHAS